MSETFAGWDRRTLELALEEVTIGLPARERSQLLARVAPRDLEDLELAVAELAIEGLGPLEAPAPGLLERLAADARAVAPRPAQRPATARPGWPAAAGWLVAAALVAVLALERVGRRAPSAAERRAELVASADDLRRAAWSPGGDPLGEGLAGDVVWSAARQEGYMLFRALPANDPARSQYQLWIFDAARDDWEEHPVDGGVFDASGAGEIVVPIAARLPVGEAALFAVTAEPPGGVVVSKREHLLATAKP